jgi:hypothetical protein
MGMSLFELETRFDKTFTHRGSSRSKRDSSGVRDLGPSSKPPPYPAEQSESVLASYRNGVSKNNTATPDDYQGPLIKDLLKTGMPVVQARSIANSIREADRRRSSAFNQGLAKKNVTFPEVSLFDESAYDKILGPILAKTSLGAIRDFLFDVCDKHNLVIAWGLGASAGALGIGVAGAAGIVILPGRRFGYFGGLGRAVGLLPKIGLSAPELTFVWGGLSAFSVASVSVEVGLSLEGIGPGVQIIFNTDGKPIGFSVAMSVSLGGSAITVAIEKWYTWVKQSNSASLSFGKWSSAYGGDVPVLDKENPEAMAKEILAFFYQGRQISNVTNDYQRLAARMLYDALEKQKWLNRLPSLPSSKPGPFWLVSEAVKMLWRECTGPKGISVAVRNAVALHWRTTLEEIENGLPPTALSSQQSRIGFSMGGWVERDIPLSPIAGGRSIDTSALKMGDIIVSTTNQIPSKLIRFGTNSSVSHARIYIGGGQVVEAVGKGVELVSLEDAIRHDSLAVAFRYPGLSDEQALRIRDYVGQQLGKPYDFKFVFVRQPLFQAGAALCNVLSEPEKSQCKHWVGKVYLGKSDDTTFVCSNLLAAGFADAGVPLTSSPANWTTPDDITLKTNLEYVGHLKTD